MSLNRNEQRVFDYLQTKAEERHYWEQKVQRIASSTADDFSAAARIEGALWEYYLERAAVAAPFREAAAREGLQRTSMRNLAELFLRQWTRPRAKPSRQEGSVSRDLEPFGGPDVFP